MKRRTPPRARRAPRRRLSVSALQSRELVKFAGILEIRPGDFLEWILSDMLKDLRNPDSGLLLSWGEDMVTRETSAQAERVKSRVNAWLARREAINARRDGKEDTVS
ncbi:MAG: hypothetical protein V4726_15955 [Verrucomicrobiota bacterium]